MSHNNLDHLVKMINQIAENMGNGEDVEAVASHVTRFWARPMKQQIVQHYRLGGDGLNSVAKQAVQQLAS
ncbi:hypothetical protein imdm_444 [gamma proteobacterium IMCC2047]|nr:hypothetical protein imdm_444 [gamma proteobacterium IMCC2047]